MADDRDIVFIEDLKLDAVIGAYEWEREIHQRLVFTIEMATDASKAKRADDLEDLDVDYSVVVKEVRSLVEKGQFHLIEAVAEAIVELLFNSFGISWVRLKVQKPRPTDGYVAGILIERTRD